MTREGLTRAQREALLGLLWAAGAAALASAVYYVEAGGLEPFGAGVTALVVLVLRLVAAAVQARRGAA